MGIHAMGIGTTELLIVLAVVLVLFGGAKLPKLARSLGQAQGEFKKGLTSPVEDDAVPGQMNQLGKGSQSTAPDDGAPGARS